MIIKKIISFEPNGDDLFFNIDFGGVGTLAYHVNLYEQDETTNVTGYAYQNYEDIQSTNAPLPLLSPPADNNNCYLELSATYTAIDAGQYHLYLQVYQGDILLEDAINPDNAIDAEEGDNDLYISIHLKAATS